MKKLFTLCSFALIIFSCTRKVSPASTPTVSDNSTTTENVVVAPAEDQHAVAIAAGRTIYNTKCMKCHEDKGVANYTATMWEGILKSMAPNAKLTPAETAQVTAYVKANAKTGQP
jgi:mono/diheme cytochrome c family protein